MAITYGTPDAAVAGTTSLVIGFPASVAAGDLLVTCICNKYPTNGPSDIAG